MSFGKRLEALIQEKKKTESFSQSELARQLGVARSIVNNWISERSEPNIATIKKIARILGLNSVGELFGEEPPTPSVDQTLLSEIMVLAEKLCQQRDVSLPPEKKAGFICAAYDMIQKRRSTHKGASEVSTASDILELLPKLEPSKGLNESGRRKGGGTTVS